MVTKRLDDMRLHNPNPFIQGQSGVGRSLASTSMRTFIPETTFLSAVCSTPSRCYPAGSDRWPSMVIYMQHAEAQHHRLSCRLEGERCQRHI